MCTFATENKNDVGDNSQNVQKKTEKYVRLWM